MGHNMGMDHDFDESHGGSNGPCNGNGIMSYGSAPNVWSTCSRADFLAHYNKIMASSSWNWCLTSKIKNFNFDKKIKRKQVYFTKLVLLLTYLFKINPFWKKSYHQKRNEHVFYLFK